MAVFDNFAVMPESAWMVVAKIVGAVSGSAVSIIYMLPRNRREAAARFVVGVMVGLIFGSTVGVKLADELGVMDQLTMIEIIMAGSAVSSLCAWWALGAVVRFARRYELPGSTPSPMATKSKPSKENN